VGEKTGKTSEGAVLKANWEKFKIQVNTTSKGLIEVSASIDDQHGRDLEETIEAFKTAKAS
jgi:hypothetical protein